MSPSFEDYLAQRKRVVESTLARVLPAESSGDGEGPERTLVAALRYAALGEGKRLRGILTLAAFEACGGDGATANVPAAALELIHAYSLVHDDLPAMDDDDLRRGRPTTHRVYGEAAAILAGDGLLTLAFELLATRPEGRDAAGRRADSVAVAARRSGLQGMVGGQIADLEATGSEVDPERLDWIHAHKTGALFSACSEIGSIHAGAAPAERAAMARYGALLGLAFQIADDLLDRSGSSDSLGKTPGKDQRAGKATYPGVHGIDASRDRAATAVQEALEALRACSLQTDALESLAALCVARTH